MVSVLLAPVLPEQELAALLEQEAFVKQLPDPLDDFAAISYLPLRLHHFAQLLEVHPVLLAVAHFALLKTPHQQYLIDFALPASDD